MQDEDPAADWYVLKGQSVQVVEPDDADMDPAGHREQLVLPTAPE